jgi:hypothetical protein
MSVSDKLAGAVVGAIAAVGVLGAGWAFAQETPSTTAPPTTEAPSQDAPADGHRDGRNCDKNGNGIPDHEENGGAAEQTSL